MWRATLAIQKIIQVMSATATIERIPPIASWASNVSVLGPKVRIAPNPIETSDRDGDACPQPADEVMALDAHEVRKEDADDERGLEAFAKTDEVVAEHGAGRLRKIRSGERRGEGAQCRRPCAESSRHLDTAAQGSRRGSPGARGRGAVRVCGGTACR